MNNRLPPETTLSPDDGDPSWEDALDGDHDGAHVLFVTNGELELKPTDEGVEVYLFVHRSKFPRWTAGFQHMMDAMGVLRRLVNDRNGGAGRSLECGLGFGYPHRNGYRAKAMTLSKGNYFVEYPQEGGTALFWRDVEGTAHTQYPRLAPEVAKHFEQHGVTPRARRKKLPPTTPKQIAPPIYLPPYVPPEQRLRDKLIAAQIQREAEQAKPLVRKRLPVPTSITKRLPT